MRLSPIFIFYKNIKYIILISVLTLVGSHSLLGNDADSLFTPQELQWLIDNEITFAPNPSWPPMDFVDKNGVHKGIIADYFALFEKKLGKSFTQITFPRWSDIIDGVKSGEVDIIGAIHKTDFREEYLLFTDPFIELQNVILVKNDYPFGITDDQINSMTIAAVSGYANINYLKANYPDVNIIEFENDLTALLQTSLGNTDGVVTDIITASYLVEHYGITNLKLGWTLDFNWQVRLASTTKHPILQSILIKLLDSIDEEQRKSILNKWVHIGNIQEAGFFVRNQRRFTIFFILLFITLLFILTHNYKLNEKVKKRTYELNEKIQEKSDLNKKLHESIEEKEVLLSEIHHRVKNNMAIVSGLMFLEELNFEDDFILNSVLTRCRMRIHSMAKIHEMLYQSGSLVNLDIKGFITEQVEDILKSKHLDSSSLNLVVNSENINLNINQAVPCALIINELVINALEYAFDSKSKGELEVSLQNKDENICITVSDNGLGLPDNFEELAAKSTSQQIITQLVNQLNGNIEVETVKNKGTSFKVLFKKSNISGSSNSYFA